MESLKRLSTSDVSNLFVYILFSSLIGNLFEGDIPGVSVVSHQYLEDEAFSLAQDIDRCFHQPENVPKMRIPSQKILEAGLMRLLGHPTEGLPEMLPANTLASAERGQVQFVNIAASFILPLALKRGLLSRVVAPGSILYEGDLWRGISSLDQWDYFIKGASNRRSFLISTKKQGGYMVTRRDRYLLTSWLPDQRRSDIGFNIRQTFKSIWSSTFFTGKHQADCVCGKHKTRDKHPDLQYCLKLGDVMHLEKRSRTYVAPTVINVVPNLGQRGVDIFYALAMFLRTDIVREGGYAIHCQGGCVYCSVDAAHLAGFPRGPPYPQHPDTIVVFTHASHEEVEGNAAQVKKEINERLLGARSLPMEPLENQHEPAVGHIPAGATDLVRDVAMDQPQQVLEVLGQGPDGADGHHVPESGQPISQREHGESVAGRTEVEGQYAHAEAARISHNADEPAYEGANMEHQGRQTQDGSDETELLVRGVVP